jgi:hypothetical protein
MLRFTLVFFVFLGACSGPRPIVEPLDPVREVVAVNHASYESFDATPYLEPAVQMVTEVPPVVHDAPAALLENRAAVRAGGGGRRVTVNGFRIQIFQSASKPEADARADQAVRWWETQASGLGLPAMPEVYTLYRAPYYRVRVGNFSSRNEANAARAELLRQFPNAFIVQDRVSVFR